MKKIDPQIVIDFLNELVELDRDCIQALIEQRVSCNEKLANHETVQVLCNTDNSMSVGLLGILNGLVGKDEESGWGYIVAEIDSSNEKLVRFVLNPKNLENNK